MALSPTFTGADQERLAVEEEVADAERPTTGPGRPEASCKLLVFLGELEGVVPDLLALTIDKSNPPM
jgi:hypothetical protein